MIYGNDLIQRWTEGFEARRDNGDYVEYEGSWGEPIQCDAFPSPGKASTIVFPDGHKDVYAYEIHIDVAEEKFEVGDKIRINVKGHSAEYIVKGYHKYSFTAKLWV